jgi:adenylosuccinate synthase
MDRVRQAGGDVSPSAIVLDRDAQLVLDYHIAVDKAREARRGANRIGTTGKGIGPAYEDRSMRSGIRVADLSAIERIRDRVAEHVDEKNRILKAVLESDQQVDFNKVWSELLAQAEVLAPYIGNGSALIHSALKRGERVIFEGAQGVLLDQIHGTYPYVTSSITVAGGAASGVGIGPRSIDGVVGLAKAYTTRVGEGPFPTEIVGGVGDRLREVGGEYGTVTGRARRCGWLDAVALKRAVRISGIDTLILTKLDVLSGLSKLGICVGYRGSNGKLDDLPARIDEYQGLEPEYIELDGWSEDISKLRNFEDLPKAAKAFVAEVERLVDCPVGLVSVGPGREATIKAKLSPLLGEFFKPSLIRA